MIAMRSVGLPLAPLALSLCLLLATCPPYYGERGKYFAKKTYNAEPVPLYEEARSRLPAPILGGNPELGNLYWKAWELLYKGNIKQPAPNSHFVSNYLNEGGDDNIYQWDTIFMIMFARYGHAVFPGVQSLDNFYCRQRDNGLIWRVFREDNGAEHWWGNSPNTVNPPLFSWAEVESYRLTGDDSRFALVLPVLEKYADWLETGRKRTGTVHDLYWNSRQGSGMDNTPPNRIRLGGHVCPDGHAIQQFGLHL
ncbi:MAG: hypothetical protein KIT09_33205 [Bryobacteraceae bacterium]|nr:hypothetical protein [Bryobacteraceae bacterium]